MTQSPETPTSLPADASRSQPAARGLIRHWLVRRLLKWLLVAMVLILIGDFCYSRYVAYKQHAWESKAQRDSDGVLVNCREYSLGTGSQAILLVHGINESPFTWRKMAPRLAEQGYHCRVMRLPGFAEPIDDYARYSEMDWVAAVHRELDELRKSHERVTIVAHSLGGAVAVNSVCARPDLCDSMVLLAPAIRVSNDRSPILPTRFWHEVGRWLPFTRVVANPFGVDARDEGERAAPNRTPLTPRSVTHNLFRLIDANSSLHDQISMPVLLVLSPHDHIINPDAAVEYFQRRKNARTEVFWNDDAGHALPGDFGWDKVTARIDSFLRGIQEQSD